MSSVPTYKIPQSRTAVSVAYSVLEGSPGEECGRDVQGPKGTRVLKCAWADRWKLAEQLMGGYINQNGQMVYFAPHLLPGNEAAEAQHVAIEPLNPKGIQNAASPVESYDHAKLTVTYSASMSAIPVIESMEETIEYVTMNHAKLYWTASDQVEKNQLGAHEAPAMCIRMWEWVIQQFRLPAIPGALGDLAGCVNSSSITSQTFGITFPAGTLLACPPKMSYELQVNGNRLYTTIARLTHRPQTWNKFPHVHTDGTLSFDDVYVTGGQKLVLYNDADLSPICGQFAQSKLPYGFTSVPTQF